MVGRIGVSPPVPPISLYQFFIKGKLWIIEDSVLDKIDMLIPLLTDKRYMMNGFSMHEKL